MITADARVMFEDGTVRTVLLGDDGGGWAYSDSSDLEVLIELSIMTGLTVRVGREPNAEEVAVDPADPATIRQLLLAVPGVYEVSGIDEPDSGEPSPACVPDPL